MPECPICLETMSPLPGNDEIFWLECCHPIHVSCKNELIEITKKCICPICKHETIIPPIDSIINKSTTEPFTDIDTIESFPESSSNINIRALELTHNIPTRILSIQPQPAKESTKLNTLIIIFSFIVITVGVLLMILYI